MFQRLGAVNLHQGSTAATGMRLAPLPAALAQQQASVKKAMQLDKHQQQQQYAPAGPSLSGGGDDGEDEDREDEDDGASDNNKGGGKKARTDDAETEGGGETAKRGRKDANFTGKHLGNPYFTNNSLQASHRSRQATNRTRGEGVMSKVAELHKLTGAGILCFVFEDNRKARCYASPGRPRQLLANPDWMHMVHSCVPNDQDLDAAFTGAHNQQDRATYQLPAGAVIPASVGFKDYAPKQKHIDKAVACNRPEQSLRDCYVTYVVNPGGVAAAIPPHPQGIPPHPQGAATPVVQPAPLHPAQVPSSAKDNNKRKRKEDQAPVVPVDVPMPLDLQQQQQQPLQQLALAAAAGVQEIPAQASLTPEPRRADFETLWMQNGWSGKGYDFSTEGVRARITEIPDVPFSLGQGDAPSLLTVCPAWWTPSIPSAQSPSVV